MNGVELLDSKNSSSDLYFASFLIAACVPFIGAERDGRKVVFVFERTSAIKDLKREYFNRSAKICALSFVDEIRNLKSLTHISMREG